MAQGERSRTEGEAAAPTGLRLRVPAHCAGEIAWVARTVFDGFLGLPVRLEPHDGPGYELITPGGSLHWPDVFFARAAGAWLGEASLPVLPLRRWAPATLGLAPRLCEPKLPVLYGVPADTLPPPRPGALHLPIDLLGSAFFLLSRYEEGVGGAAAPALDRHERCTAAGSVAGRAGFLLRPLVDEYVEILWAALQRLAPGLVRRQRSASVWVSCDVDAPYSSGIKSLAGLARQIGGDLLRRHSPAMAARSLLNAAWSRAGDYRHEAYDRFDWMMSANEAAGRRISFFFLSVVRPQPIDGWYELAEPRIRGLLRRIGQRGHEIGLHGSYDSHRDATVLRAQAESLMVAMRREGLRQEQLCARQHYLRWHSSDTPRCLEPLRLAYDSTLAYADAIGFRCGTTQPYTLYDLQHRRPLALVERPLVMMEVSALDPIYMNLGHGDDALATLLTLKQTCLKFDGEFSLLWHNSNLHDPRDQDFYRELIR